MYLILVWVSGTELLNPLQFPVRRPMKVSLVMLKARKDLNLQPNGLKHHFATTAKANVSVKKLSISYPQILKNMTPFILQCSECEGIYIRLAF